MFDMETKVTSTDQTESVNHGKLGWQQPDTTELVDTLA